MKMKIKDMPTIAGIYKINYPNGKIYIGQSQNIRKRILEHNQRATCVTSDRALQVCDVALRKYNYVIDEIEILEIVTNVEILDDRESYWIAYYNSSNKDIGYNIVIEGNVSSKRGTSHVNAAFTQDTLAEVVDLLIHHTELSIIDIAKKYNVSTQTIRRILTGQSYYNPELDYPLRKNNHDSRRKNELTDYFESEEKLLNLKQDLYFRWDLAIEKDLTKIYNIPLKILRDINNGKRFQEYGNYTYPIRQKNIRNNKNFSIQEISNILSDLRETSLSQTVIGEKYGIHRNTVNNINQGKSYPIKDYDYPARK